MPDDIYRTEITACPICGYQIDAHSCLDKEHVATPAQGDYSICMKCGGILRYGEHLELKEATEDDMEELDPGNAKYLARAQYIVRNYLWKDRH